MHEMFNIKTVLAATVEKFAGMERAADAAQVAVTAYAVVYLASGGDKGTLNASLDARQIKSFRTYTSAAAKLAPKVADTVRNAPANATLAQVVALTLPTVKDAFDVSRIGGGGDVLTFNASYASGGDGSPVASQADKVRTAKANSADMTKEERAARAGENKVERHAEFAEKIGIWISGAAIDGKAATDIASPNDLVMMAIASIQRLADTHGLGIDNLARVRQILEFAAECAARTPIITKPVAIAA